MGYILVNCISFIIRVYILMKVMFVKNAGGLLSPANEMEAERLKRIPNGSMHEIDIKGSQKRSNSFHGKVFSFMNYCFQYWNAHNTQFQYQCEKAQFDSFRKQLTIQAGYFDWCVDLRGQPVMQARSLSFDSMDQETFEQFNIAIQNAAMATLFDANDTQAIKKLESFF